MLCMVGRVGKGQCGVIYMYVCVCIYICVYMHMYRCMYMYACIYNSWVCGGVCKSICINMDVHKWDAATHARQKSRLTLINTCVLRSPNAMERMLHITYILPCVCTDVPAMCILVYKCIFLYMCIYMLYVCVYVCMNVYFAYSRVCTYVCISTFCLYIGYSYI